MFSQVFVEIGGIEFSCCSMWVSSCLGVGGFSNPSVATIRRHRCTCIGASVRDCSSSDIVRVTTARSSGTGEIIRVQL